MTCGIHVANDMIADVTDDMNIDVDVNDMSAFMAYDMATSRH